MKNFKHLEIIEKTESDWIENWLKKSVPPAYFENPITGNFLLVVEKMLGTCFSQISEVGKRFKI